MDNDKLEFYEMIMDIAKIIVADYHEEILKVFKCIPNLNFEFAPWLGFDAYQSGGNITLNIGRIEFNFGKHFMSKATLILVVETMIHEMFHIEQSVDYEKYDEDLQYTNEVETQTVFASRLFIADHIEEICDLLVIDIKHKDEVFEIMAHFNMNYGFVSLKKYPRVQTLKDIYMNYLTLAMHPEEAQRIAETCDNYDDIVLSILSTNDITDDWTGGKVKSTVIDSEYMKENNIWQSSNHLSHMFQTFTGDINRQFTTSIMWYSQIYQDNKFDNMLHVDLIRDNNYFRRIYGFNTRTVGFIVNKEDEFNAPT